VAVLSLMDGCASKPARQGVQPLSGQSIPVLNATCYPPVGWTPQPLKSSGRHDHQVWLSPSGHTAYGVIHFSLPLPVSADVALWGFLREMKRSEGAAELIDKHTVSGEEGLRFEAVGGLYRIRGRMITHGWQGWTIYAGTLVKQEIDTTELKTAEQARDRTRTGTVE